jgi:hypothetical protein
LTLSRGTSTVEAMNVLRFPLLDGLEGVSCVFVGRGPSPRPDPAGLLGLLDRDGRRPVRLATARQVHSDRCLVLAGHHCGVAGEADALITRERGLALGIAAADCVPLVAIDPQAGVLGMVHAGWRGTLAGVLEKALDRMRRDLGARPERILVCAGPAAGPCCYQVGSEVVEAFGRKRPTHSARALIERRPGEYFLDLIEANRLQAEEAGVAGGRFGALAVCTVCRPDLCHSYRRDGASAGRMWLLATLTDPATRPSS